MSTSLSCETAEFHAAPSFTECTACKGPLGHSYYQANGDILCPNCAHSVDRLLAPVGGRLGRVIKALALGALAALAGAAVHYAVLHFLNINAALVTIFMGYLVGAAVRKGSGNRGGWRYQTIAVVLTYLSIATAYVPLAFEEAANSHDGKPAITATTDGGLTHAAPAVVKPAEPAPEAAAAAVSPLGLVALLAALVAGFFALPVIVGISSPLSLLIFGFGIYRAWQINQRVRLELTGPHSLGSEPVLQPPPLPA